LTGVAVASLTAASLVAVGSTTGRAHAVNAAPAAAAVETHRNSLRVIFFFTFGSLSSAGREKPLNAGFLVSSVPFYSERFVHSTAA